MALPESVKIARVGILPGSSISGVKFPMNLGENEVAILLSINYFWSGIPGIGTNTVTFGIWKKTDSDPASIYTDHSDMIWSIREAFEFVTESIRCSGKDHIILPWPLILIRPPRLITQIGIITSSRMEMRLFYIIEEVSDEQLAKLMVKDHA